MASLSLRYQQPTWFSQAVAVALEIAAELVEQAVIEHRH
jgi:hypothetical protein